MVSPQQGLRLLQGVLHLRLGNFLHAAGGQARGQHHHRHHREQDDAHHHPGDAHNNGAAGVQPLFRLAALSRRVKMHQATSTL